MSAADIKKQLEKRKSGDIVTGIDGVTRSKEAEQRINALCQTVLQSEGGKQFMDYLRSITLNFVVPPTGTDAQLRHHEGKRELFMILQGRCKARKD